MTRFGKIAFGTIAAAAVFSGGAYFWLESLARDDGPEGRPSYGSYAWGEKQSTPRGGPSPRKDGYVMGSAGNDFILPPLPPTRPMDIHRADTVAHNASLKSCFWPGPKLRPGFYTTDPDDYGIENQLPDTMNTFVTAWFSLPPGAKLLISGDFPHMRHWSFTTYSEDGVPRDALDDVDIEPAPGSLNPYRSGVPRNASPRRYSFSIESGTPPAQRPSNTLYTLSPPGSAIGMHMRNYVPDRSKDYLGSVALPEVRLQLADGTLLTGEEACAATKAPLRGKQVPLTVKKSTWLALNSLPWRPADRTPAHDFEVEAMERFYNRPYLILKTFFPWLALDTLADERGGFWSNRSTRYGYKYLSQAYGSVYAVTGRMPTTPQTWRGDTIPMAQNVDMRYWSLCSVQAPPTGQTVDCLFDETVLPTLDAQRNFYVVVSRAPDRPSNATEACGVAWMEFGNGDGIPGGSTDYGALINRHTGIGKDFHHSWFAATHPGGEERAMGDYLPKVLNYRSKEAFQALGCPVDKTRIATLARTSEIVSK